MRLNHSDKFIQLHRFFHEAIRMKLRMSSFLLGAAENWRFGEGKENHLLAGYRADIMVQGQHLDAGDLA